jgi:activated CDC42 kinase 1
MSHSQKNDDAVFYALLESVQLESFYTLLRDKLQITRISHFDYVKTKDLEQAGMSKPAIRRLLDAVEKHHTTSPVAPARPPPLPPSLPCSSPTDNNGQIVTEILADHSRNVKSNPEPFFSKVFIFYFC